MSLHLGVFLILTAIAVVIMIAVYVPLWLWGNSGRAERSAIEAVRWFAAGSVIAVVGDALQSDSVSDGIVPGAIALVMLVLVEYLAQWLEDNAPEA